MLFSIAMALMVVLIGGFWTYQGCFSSALMFFECVVACLAAFSSYEALNGVWVSTLGSGVGLPLAFGLIFLAVLGLLRVATDRYFKDNIKLPIVADRVGAGVFGLFTGLLLVGNALVAVQMLPIGGDFFGYDRVKMKPDGSLSQSGIMLSPDGFTVGLANVASGGGMSGGNSLSTAKPGLLMGLYSARCAVQTEDRIDVPEDGVKVNAYWESRQIDSVKQRLEGNNLVREFETRDVSTGKLLVFDVTVDVSACLKEKNEMYLRVPQFRIVGPPPDSGRSPEVYLATGMSDLYTHRGHNWPSLQEGQSARLVQFKPDTDFFIGGSSTKAIAEPKEKDKNTAIKGWRFNVAFQVPDGFEPWYLAFKSGARAEINKQKMFKAAPPKGASVALGNTGPGRSVAEVEKPKVGKAPGGATHVANAIEERTGAFDDLPMALARTERVVERALKGGKLGECHFFVEVPEKPPAKGEQVTKFFVAEGKTMLQIGAEKNEALSMYGRAMNYASNVAGQISIETADGKQYVAQGVYAAAPINGKMMLEIQYIDDADMSDLRLKQPKKVTASVLKSAPPDQRKFGYIFIVEPGVKIVSFSSGGVGKSQPLNLTVPP